MIRAGVVAAIMLATAGEVQAERLTLALSTSEVQISASFTGTAVTVLGVIEGDQANALADGSYQVAVVALGPSQTVVARRKDRILGVWANSAGVTFAGVPAVYVLNSSSDLGTMAAPSTLQRLALGYDNIAFAYADGTRLDDADAAEFRAAYVRLKERSGLFSQAADVQFVSNAIFRSTLALPASIPVGRYTVQTFLFSNGTLIAHAQDTFVVSKTGFEQALAGFADGHSLIYGLFCVGLAVFVGWLGGVIFRRD